MILTSPRRSLAKRRLLPRSDRQLRRPPAHQRSRASHPGRAVGLRLKRLRLGDFSFQAKPTMVERLAQSGRRCFHAGIRQASPCRRGPSLGAGAGRADEIAQLRHSARPQPRLPSLTLLAALPAPADRRPSKRTGIWSATAARPGAAGSRRRELDRCRCSSGAWEWELCSADVGRGASCVGASRRVLDPSMRIPSISTAGTALC